MCYQTTGDGTFTHAGGDATGIFFESTDPVTFTAYYPFYGTEGESPATIKDVTTDNQKKQTKFDFLFATASASRKDPILSFTGENAFKHKMTRLIINIKTDPNSGFYAEHVTIGQYSISGIKHSGTFNTVNGIATATGDASADWNITAEATDNDNVRTYDMILYPQTDASLTFKANIAGQKYVSPAITPALAAGTSYTYTITVKKTGLEVSTCTIDDWKPGTGGDIDAGMELPKLIGDKTAAQAEVGDFYFSDGSFADKETVLSETQKEACIGVCFYNGPHDTDNSDYSTTGIAQNECHGYAMALTDVSSNPLRWCYDPESQLITSTDKEDWNGYYNQQQIANNGLGDYPAAEACASFGTGNEYQAPANSSGWFLPSCGQLTYIHSISSELKTSVENAGGTWFGRVGSYWTSSQHTDFYTYQMSLVYGLPNDGGKTYQNYVRAIIAF